MTAEQLAEHLKGLTAAADVVEAINDRELQRQRGWDLSGWDYELVPWGVRFLYRHPKRQTQEEVVVRLSVEGPRRCSRQEAV